jgi:hypothetical protein
VEEEPDGNGALSEAEARVLRRDRCPCRALGGGPPADWVVDRMQSSSLQTWAELEQLRSRGLIAGGDRELRATHAGVKAALASRQLARYQQARRSRPA